MSKDSRKSESSESTYKTRLPEQTAPEAAPQLEAIDALALQRAVDGPGFAAPNDILNLQRTAGNRAVSRLIQTKLTVGPAGDKYEQEADAVAEKVLRMPAPRRDNQARPEVQRQEEEEELAQPKLLIRRRPVAPSDGANDGEQGDKPGGIQRAAAGDGSFQPGHDFERSLSSASGDGSPLPSSVRSYMEPRLGADFSNVKVHTGSQSVQLNREIGAQAFTRGSDVFFGAGKYNPGTTGGKRLLAHELTHVVQQGGADVQAKPAAYANTSSEKIQTDRPANRDSIQRMSWKDTDWSQAKEAWASAGGGSGVLFVKDDTPDPPVVVKSGEDATAETVLAANLHEHVGRATEDPGGWGLTAPGARVISPNEGTSIKQHVSAVIREGDARAAKLVDATDKPGTMAFQYAGGREFEEMMKGTAKHSKKRWFRRRTLRKNSPFNLFRKKSFVEALGRASAVDIFMGNWDRLTVYFNAENFMVDMDSKTIGLIDNIQMNMEFSFKTFSDERITQTGAESFRAWSNKDWVRNLANDDYIAIANKMIETISDSLDNLRDEDKDTIRRKLDKNGRVVQWLARGLQQGKAQIVSKYHSMESLTEGMAPEDKQEVLQSLNSRIAFLVHGTDD
ncbi:MAG: DUF4157 domain-containing protein [Anaerolineales bacterium]